MYVEKTLCCEVQPWMVRKCCRTSLQRCLQHPKQHPALLEWGGCSTQGRGEGPVPGEAASVGSEQLLDVVRSQGQVRRSLGAPRVGDGWTWSQGPLRSQGGAGAALASGTSQQTSAAHKTSLSLLQLMRSTALRWSPRPPLAGLTETAASRGCRGESCSAAARAGQGHMGCLEVFSC